MSGNTTELNLKTAVDADDTADYLTLSLADSLRTVDALFNNVTGHNHSGAHQGGPLAAGSIPGSALAPGAITSAQIADGTITGADIADGTITGAELAAGLALTGGLSVTGQIVTNSLHIASGPNTLLGATTMDSLTVTQGANIGSVLNIVGIGNSLTFHDGTVRLARNANALHSYGSDSPAWYYWRGTDNASCGSIDITGFHNPSTLKNKHAIVPLDGDGLRLVLDARIRPIRYVILGGQAAVPDSRSIGFGAEEMAPVIPEVVGLDPVSGEPLSINYGALVPVLWDAIRTLNNRIEAINPHND